MILALGGFGYRNGIGCRSGSARVEWSLSKSTAIGLRGATMMCARRAALLAGAAVAGLSANAWAQPPN